MRETGGAGADHGRVVPEGAAGRPAGGGGPALGGARGAGLRGQALDLRRIRPCGRPCGAGVDGARRGAGRACRALDDQPGGMALSRLRHRQGRRRAGAAQHPLPHRRRGLHDAAVRQRDLDQHRPLRPGRLRGDADGGAARPGSAGPPGGPDRRLPAPPPTRRAGREGRCPARWAGRRCSAAAGQ